MFDTDAIQKSVGRGIMNVLRYIGYAIVGLVAIVIMLGLRGSSITSHASAQLSSIRASGDAELVNGEMDYGVLVTFTVTNTGEEGAITVTPSVSCSEGTWTRKQEVLFAPGQSMELKYFFHEPTINATNIQSLVKCQPGRTTE
jgi:hypothetical protein